MTTQESIKILRNLQKRSRKKIVNFLGIPNGEYDDIVAECNAIEVAIKALERQKPKKPIHMEDEGIRYTDPYRCPTCERAFAGTGIADYCYHCGQRINWEE